MKNGNYDGEKIIILEVVNTGSPPTEMEHWGGGGEGMMRELEKGVQGGKNSNSFPSFVLTKILASTEN